MENPLVLVVDDEPFVVLAIEAMLKKIGCIVDKASNGDVGVKMILDHNKAESTKYNLVLMDINMPVLNGYEAAKRVRECALLQPPIVCLSAQESASHNSLCMSCGFDMICKALVFYLDSEKAVLRGHVAGNIKSIELTLAIN